MRRAHHGAAAGRRGKNEASKGKLGGRVHRREGSYIELKSVSQLLCGLDSKSLT